MQVEDSETGGRTSEEPDAATGPQVYLRSTIGFPYSPLRDAELIARALHDEWGGKASPDQLAAGLNASPKSGAYRTKIATARTFGVTSATRGSISLTELGRRLIDPQARDAARVEAFLSVPLFAALEEEYKGSMLPPDSGLEQKICDLGVSSKQTAKARQAFQRSAEQAGFFRHGRQRLVRPGNLATASSRRESSGRQAAHDTTGASRGGTPLPLVDLWVALLDDGEQWSAEKIQEYVAAARLLRNALAKDG